MKESRRDEEGHVLTRPRMDGRTDFTRYATKIRLSVHFSSAKLKHSTGTMAVQEKKNILPEKCLSPEVGLDDQDASQSSTTISSQYRLSEPRLNKTYRMITDMCEDGRSHRDATQ